MLRTRVESNRLWAVLALGSVLAASGALAAEPKDLIGKWRWKDFTVDVAQCEGGALCAKIIEGPKNVGVQVFGRDLTAKDGDLFGQFTHPETKEVYNTRLRQESPDKWRLDGCTAARVCLSGEFARVK
jgi:uncharacterized protein (DUF2147 family)